MIENNGLKVRKLNDNDKHFLVKWLSDSSVLEYYEGRDNAFDLAKVNNVFFDCEEDEVKCIVELERKAIGYVQFYKIDKITKENFGYSFGNIYGMDQFIGETEYWNRGVGTLLVSSVVSFLYEYEKADKVIMDPQVRNLRALRCYEKCGFKKVKILPKHELHKGEYRDCWLIEHTRD
ncbi:GNAT family N-acetyltransferase [Cytobacillus horneckiae]|uniref:GNAT family N-acetyltransferase n=1 Tax=Cytobacillus horneckiae TaxID=549687 RepID=UPI003D9A67A0